MKIKNIVTVFLIAFILASCAPAAKVVSTETAIPISTFTPIPPIPTITPTLTPENISDAKDLSVWVDEFVHAYGEEFIMGDISIDSVQLLNEIKTNPATFLQAKQVNRADYLFLVVNNIPLAIQDKNGKWEKATIRKIADLFGYTVGVFVSGPSQNDKGYQEIYASVANKIIIGASLDTDVVFKNFTADDWQKILSNWDSINTSLDDGQLPSNFPYFWDWADSKLRFAKTTNIQLINAQHLLWRDVPDTIINGNFTADELEKILEFTTKTRVIKYKGVITHWNAVDEIVGKHLYATKPKERFWGDKLGYEVVPKMINWVYETDPNAVIGIVEPAEGQEFPNAVKVQESEFLKFLQFIKDNVQDEVFANVVVGVEGYEWIYGWDYSGKSEKELAAFLENIRSMGYRVYVCETAVIGSDKHPIWQQRVRRTASVENKLLVQAEILGIVARLNFSKGEKEIGLGGLTDSTEWFDSAGHPDANAMIFDDKGKAKPSYYALIQVLYEQLP